MKICVIDDELTIRKGIVQKIEELAPYAVVYDLGYGHKALEQLMFVRPDLAFVDIFMPEINGLEMLKRVKDFLPNTRFVILTGYGEFKYAQEALQLGVKNYLLKPVYHKVLLLEIEDVRNHMQSKVEAELADGLHLLALSGYQINISKVYRPSAWLDSQAAKKIIFTLSENIMNLMENPILTFTTGKGGLGAIIETQHNDTNAFYNRLVWTDRLKPILQLFETTCYFVEDETSAQLRVARDPAPIIAAANKIRWDIMTLLDSGEYREEKIRIQLRKWLDTIGTLSYHLLRQECVELIAACDEFMRKRDRGFVKEEDVRGWGKWVDSFGQWPQLKEQIENLIAKGLSTLVEFSRNEASTADNMIERLNELLDSEISLDKLTLQWVADRMHMHPVTVSRLFKKKTGMNFVDYLTDRKMNLAKKLLLYTPKKINVIASELGYSNYRYFGHLFKNHFGLPPNQFRREK
jgi:two-component system response regulator YesN